MAHMGMGTLLIACPSCACHAFARETRCPSCGALLRAADGSIQRTAGAVLLGLSITVATAACGSSSGGTGGGGGAGHGGAGGMSSSSMGGFQAVTNSHHNRIWLTTAQAFMGADPLSKLDGEAFYKTGVTPLPGLWAAPPT